MTETAKDGFGWMLFRKEGRKRVAHVAHAGPCGTPFVPVFPTRRDALEYRDKRLQIPRLVAKRLRIGDE
jgi:hypothetical protein